MSAIVTISITFLLYLICHAQEKETVSKKSLSYTLSSQTPEIIYINFDKDKGDVKLTQESGEMLFSLKKADSRYNKHTLLFTFHPKEMSRKKIRYDSIRKQIINGIEAKNKVDLLLEKRAQKCESELDQKDKNNTIYCNMIRHPFIYEYNSYFKIIYLYEPIDAEHGTLYEVTWNFYVELGNQFSNYVSYLIVYMKTSITVCFLLLSIYSYSQEKKDSIPIMQSNNISIQTNSTGNPYNKPETKKKTAPKKGKKDSKNSKIDKPLFVNKREIHCY